ncbi:Uu.00g058580.m01.CDS01 [Anthostomella pinea]|uniref:ubiquitinyl hydrolase 1 n=1 Tax=Anthostomella pinea TaxID=933095 RepID=A0AAI8VSR3_9PEZI|nr:Uu.00g058580.m01.CDS01 [Anthostomella pinea]
MPTYLPTLVAKTPSSKKRKIATRKSAKDENPHTPTLHDIPLQSCEDDSDYSFSFTTQAQPDTPSEPAYIRNDSLPPASSLPPRLQTNNSSSLACAEDASSTASSPSGAYADLTIHSDRGGDTPAPELSVALNNHPPPPGRGTSPFAKTTHHRAIMGGAADFPERASSPLKRRASSMDPDAPEQHANEDVDMIAAPPPTTDTNTEPPSEQAGGTAAMVQDTEDKTAMSTASDGAVPSTITSAGMSTNAKLPIRTHRPLVALQPPESLEQHVRAIRSLLEESQMQPLAEGQQRFLVSNKWLSHVPDESSSKKAKVDLSLIPPVDNSDIIAEIIVDPLVGNCNDVLKKKFVRLKPGYDTEQFTAFPPAAWDLLMQWPGLKDGQLPIIRTAHDNSQDKIGLDVVFEWHPPVLSIHRLWSAQSMVPVEASMKSRNPPPPRLVRSRTFNYQTFLKQAKALAQIDLSHKIRAWTVPQRPEAVSSGAIVPTPPASPGDKQDIDNNSADPFNHLLLDVASFLALEKGPERDLVDFADLTADPQHTSAKTLGYLGILADQSIVLDPHEGGNNWTSTFTTSQARISLPTSNSSNSLTVQNRNARSGRTSPASQGPLTRGRANRSGRTTGCVGLGNLGNTCYMNAALQCVRSVEELTKYFLAGEWERELNRDNPLAYNGDIAGAYAQLLKDIYKDSAPSSVMPRQFKNAIGRHSTGFSGYGQQDSQEFVGFLLDGLQEDLSRIKKKPYIEKPDSTDEMINDPVAIRRMADEVWGITRKRDDSVIADLFTGLYKSTLVCPCCGKVSITFDPFNNLTLQLPVANKWSHEVKFYPLNDRPINIRVEVDKHDSVKALKDFVSARTGVPAERLHGAEEWKDKFYKHYPDAASVSEEIGTKDDPSMYELEAKPTNTGAKPQKQQRLGMGVRSMVDEDEVNVTSWDTEQSQSLLVPVFHRRPDTHKSGYYKSRWSACVAPYFIVVTPREARSEDAIRRKVLEKVATFTKHPMFARQEESDSSDSTEAEMIGPNGSDTSSSGGSKVIAQSVKGEDDLVDVHMKDAGDSQGTARSHSVRHQFNHKRPVWVDTNRFLPAELQNLFAMGYFSENGTHLPTGFNTVSDDKEYPSLSSRAQPESPSSEDQDDNATNGTASNDDSSSDEVSRPSTNTPPTRMNDESDDDSPYQITKVTKSFTMRPKQSRQVKTSKKLSGKKAKGRQNMKGKKGAKRVRQQQHKIDRKQALESEDAFDSNEPLSDGGPLIRYGEAIVVDWTTSSYNEIFGTDDNGKSLDVSNATDTMADPDLDKSQAARAKRKKNGISLEECLDEFERDEILSEQDMWYCPRCKEHRRASKKLDLWKSPDILIMHLKRFSSSGFRRDKLETLVDFPIENLDISSRVLAKDDGKQEVYDLIGVDCHYGGLGGGHYTAYAKNFVDGQWYSYNDSSVSKISPDRIMDSSAYLLFYRRRSNVPLGGTHFRQLMEQFSEDVSDNDMPDSGEGQRLGEGFSQNGSSSAFQGAEASRLHGSHGGNFKRDDDAPVLTNTHFVLDSSVHRSIEDDEGVDLSDDVTRSTGFNPVIGTNSWSFENISGRGAANTGDSPLYSGAASDEAQHDLSDDERVGSPIDADLENFPGMSHYELAQSEVDPPSYTQSSAPEYEDQPDRGGMKGQVYEVLPDGENEQRSEDATEIHLDDDDKIKLA